MEQKITKRTWASINLDAISENVKKITALLNGKSKIMAIVKADAYGHGAPVTAKELADAGVDFFGVSSVDEAMQLRASGIKEKILILGYTPKEDFDTIIENDIIQTVFDFDYAKSLNDAAVEKGKILTVHIKADTGMNRLGFKYTQKNHDNDTVEKIKSIVSFKNIYAEGIYTHFAASDDIKSGYTGQQYSRFIELVDKLKSEGVEFMLKHSANSGATLNYKETYLDYVRCGLILYGLYPSKNSPDIGITPAMQLKTTISQIETVMAGETVSYNRTYEAGENIKVATLPIGYADGFSRLLSNSASVIVNGRKAPVIGRVCMDQSMIDVTRCENAAAGDTVTIFGGDNGEFISVEQVADMMETINYEVICLIGKRVPRIFYRSGVEVGQLNYIVQR